MAFDNGGLEFNLSCAIMTKVWDVVALIGFVLIAAGASLLWRGESTASLWAQLIVFIILGSILLVLGFVMRYVQRGDTDLPDITTRPYSLAILGVGACLTGLYWSTAGEGPWAHYASLPVTNLADLTNQPAGSYVRVEGTARSNPPLLDADGTELALQRVEFKHETGGSRSSKTVHDYVGILPRIMALTDQKAGSSGARIATDQLDPDFSFLPRTYTALDGEKADVARRAANAISPAFTDYHYVRSGSSGVSVLSLKQDSAVTVCGTLEKPANASRPQIRAFTISSLTGDAFAQRGRNISVSTHAIAIVWWALGLGLLTTCYLAYRRYRGN
jgi:hypothetical protein